MKKLKVIRIHSDRGDTRIIATEIISDRFIGGYMLYSPLLQNVDGSNFESLEDEIELYINSICELHEHPALIVDFREEDCFGVLITTSVDVFIEELQTVTNTRSEGESSVEKIVKKFKAIKNEIDELGLSADHNKINLEKTKELPKSKFDNHKHFLLKRDIWQSNVDHNDDTWVLVCAGDSYNQIEGMFKNRCNNNKNNDNSQVVYAYAAKCNCILHETSEKLFRIEYTANELIVFIDNNIISNIGLYIENANKIVGHQKVTFIEIKPSEDETV
jgi:hypothetical protein